MLVWVVVTPRRGLKMSSRELPGMGAPGESRSLSGSLAALWLVATWLCAVKVSKGRSRRGWWMVGSFGAGVITATTPEILSGSTGPGRQLGHLGTECWDISDIKSRAPMGGPQPLLRTEFVRG